ncbi:class I SAM-dependent methyltransferase [Sphingomonas panacisoli]|uniref:Class I SAM-dependent methyltransferase n=1 Tax=Sphingomonas panacisoli TaxID=1813879 RepID=A0A5B8LJG4_9SPHN|nr:class I SAM-dependent methyltransferase [Sphingomonas panacisoli]QDZ08009.1 class I SAM-dependent methyltransferase [Sphingomonas panacisoli]
MLYLKRLTLSSLIIIPALLAMPAPAGSAAAKRAASPLARALADPARGTDRTADDRRHPAALIALAGVKPGQRVLDLIPGSGYWTRIFSRIVGPRGRVYAVWPEAYGKLAQPNVATLRAMSATPAFANVVTSVQPTTDLTAPEPLDMVWTSQNYHDYADPFMGSPGPDSLARAVFKMLKPGGVFMVIDHMSAPGRGMADTDKLHRIDPETVKKQAKAAGFEFVGESRVLINTIDPLTVPVFNASIRGRTSQFAFKFRKPMR